MTPRILSNKLSLRQIQSLRALRFAASEIGGPNDDCDG
jgi:hypothetical protein